VKKDRPVNLDLTKFKFPPMALISICHRITGVLLFLLLPLMLYLLHHSLSSSAGFSATLVQLHHPVMKFFVWVTLSAALFHLIAGIRHISMDLGFGENVCAGRATAYIVFVVAAILIVLAGVWLW
jgi:succinate dehydrogenase / fumarate reductase cytochrome b subunit